MRNYLVYIKFRSIITDYQKCQNEIYLCYQLEYSCLIILFTSLDALLVLYICIYTNYVFIYCFICICQTIVCSSLVEGMKYIIIIIKILNRFLTGKTAQICCCNIWYQAVKILLLLIISTDYRIYWKNG